MQDKIAPIFYLLYIVQPDQLHSLEVIKREGKFAESCGKISFAVNKEPLWAITQRKFIFDNLKKKEKKILILQIKDGQNAKI